VSQAQDAWNGYREAAFSLHAATAAEGAGAIQESAVDDLLARSDALESALAEHLSSDDGDVRQLAALQLQAAATFDIDRANLLAASEDEVAPAATLSDDELGELDRILSTDTNLGITAVLDDPGPRATLAQAPALPQAVNDYIDAIVASAADKSGAVLNTGLALIPWGQIGDAIGKGADSALSDASSGLGWLKRKAVSLLRKGVRKLIDALGVIPGPLKDLLKGWLGDLEKGAIGFLLGKAYDVDDRKKELAARLPSSIPDTCAQAARQELDTLRAAWDKRMGTVGTLAKVMSAAGGWFAHLSPPATEVAFGALVVVVTGYVVVAGGDYLDWHEGGGPLDLVPGVGAVVNRAVTCAGA